MALGPLLGQDAEKVADLAFFGFTSESLGKGLQHSLFAMRPFAEFALYVLAEEAISQRPTRIYLNRRVFRSSRP